MIFYKIFQMKKIFYFFFFDKKIKNEFDNVFRFFKYLKTIIMNLPAINNKMKNQ
jgi:hypothetical protein